MGPLVGPRKCPPPPPQTQLEGPAAAKSVHQHCRLVAGSGSIGSRAMPAIMSSRPTRGARDAWELKTHHRARQKLAKPLSQHRSLKNYQCSSERQKFREKSYTPTPPSPSFWPEGLFSEKGGGGWIFRAPRGRNLTSPPSFIHPPSLEGHFQGWGGVQIWSPKKCQRFGGTSAGNNFWELAGIFQESYCQYWFLVVLRPNASAPVVDLNYSPTTNRRPPPPPMKTAHMAWKGGVRMPYFLHKSLFKGLLCHTDPHCMAYSWDIFLGKYGGWSELFSFGPKKANIYHIT